MPYWQPLMTPGDDNVSIMVILYLQKLYLINSSPFIWKTCTNSVVSPWWHNEMETFSMLLDLCVGNSLVTGKFPSQRPVTWCFDVFFDLCLNKRLSKQLWGWWFEMPTRSLWHHCNAFLFIVMYTSNLRKILYLLYNRKNHQFQWIFNY